MRNRAEIINAIVEFFAANEDVFNDCMEQLDNYNGYLGDNRYYLMDDIDELFQGSSPLEILNRAFFGHDECYHENENGTRVYEEFNPNKEYFTFNGYGNLISADYIDYSAYNDKWAVEAMAENRQYIDAIDDDDELTALFDELEEADE